MSKKKHDVMEKERQNFVHGARKEDGSIECAGAVANGVSERAANEIFDEMSSFASYAFNKSHAAAYALISYQTAYLKRHYTKEYMAALLTSILDSTDKVVYYIEETKKQGIDVLPPDINASDIGFTVEGDSIRFGLLALKNLGRGFIRSLLEERKDGRFKNLLDFFERMSGKELGKRTVESLIKCGALDSFGHERGQMLRGFEALLDGIEATRRNNIEGQLDLFGAAESAASGDYVLPQTEPLSLMQRLSGEKETTGLYITGHPLSEYDGILKELRTTPIRDLLSAKNMDGKPAQIIGIIGSKKLKTTRSNDMMAFIGLEDKTGTIEAIVFPRPYALYTTLLNVGEVVVISGKIKAGEEEEAQIVCEQIRTPKEAINEKQNLPGSTAPQKQPAKSSAKRGLYLKFPDEESRLVEPASNFLFVFEGSFPVYFYYQKEKRYVRTPGSYWVDVNDILLRELRRLMGEENVVLKQ